MIQFHGFFQRVLLRSNHHVLNWVYKLLSSGPIAPAERTFKMRTPYAEVIYMVINNINLGSKPIKIQGFRPGLELCVCNKKLGKVNFTRSNPNKSKRNKNLISFRKYIKEGKLFWPLVAHIYFLLWSYVTDFDVYNIGGYVCHLRLFGTM